MNRRLWRRLLGGTVLLALMAGGVWLGQRLAIEMETSELQARFLSAYARGVSFELRDGPAPNPRFPKYGPYDERLGYVGLPKFLAALAREGYAIELQARLSHAFDRFMAIGGFAVYREKTRAGITLRDRNGDMLYASRYPERVFDRFEDIPKLVIETLLFIENRELLDRSEVLRNPAVEWDRFFAALAMLPLKLIRPGTRAAGGSTLATQIEKFRHSPDGQTGGPVEKLRQMLTASLRAYMDGPDTSAARHRIVVDYLNSTPLTARSGIGEVNGLGDGLWAWYGTDIASLGKVLSETTPTDPRARTTRAMAFKQALSLLLAQRRPSYYLTADRGALSTLTDTYLRLLYTSGIIDEALRDDALRVRLSIRDEPPPISQTSSFIGAKAPNALRARLMTMLGLGGLYQLDRIDLTADSTLDGPTQRRVVDALSRLHNPEFLKAAGLVGERLLTTANDPDNVIYSLTLCERGPEANYVLVQADNLDQPMDINEGAKLDLGSTAKLRTLVSYLEIIAEQHARMVNLPRAEVREIADDDPDTLTTWVATWLSRPGASRELRDILEAAMARHYSGSPGEQFFTGGGLHTFENFDNKHGGSMSVAEGLRHSVNLVFIRVMRDVVHYYIAQAEEDADDLLSEPDHPARQNYLERFAAREGGGFLQKFYRDYKGKTPDEALEIVGEHVRPIPARLAAAFRTVRPNADRDEMAAFVRNRMEGEGARVDDGAIDKFFHQFAPGKFPLGDLGYVARLHPLELWLAAYLQQHPEAKFSEVLEASADARRDSYAWLFKKGQAAQNTRIRIELEEQGFKRLTAAWRRVGYPFPTLVPSLATAIGSSADRPAALAELMGILLNDGVRLPVVRLRRLHFAAGTPYETVVGLGLAAPERIMPAEVAQTARKALLDVVEHGTAHRAYGVFKDKDGEIMPVGGKTGTGDHRFERHGAGGGLIESIAVNRSATFVFFIGDRFFGTVTAHVHGEDADDYHFTSALVAQLLKSLAPALQPLLERDPPSMTTATGTSNGQPAFTGSSPHPGRAGMAALTGGSPLAEPQRKRDRTKPRQEAKPPPGWYQPEPSAEAAPEDQADEPYLPVRPEETIP
ncbi:peptidoglycan glycosyltransferase [uncultured Gammaproteobacteria bacterium]